MKPLRHTSPARPSAPGAPQRAQFYRDLEALEDQTQAMAGLARLSLELSMRAVARKDAALCESVIAGDDELDQLYHQITRRAIDLLACQQPVASDLRLLVALMHVALHLERIGDMAVNVAEAERAAMSLPVNPAIVQHLHDMGDAAALMTDLASRAFRERDRNACERLSTLDERIDRFNRDMINHVLACSDDGQQLEWAIRMMQVSRYLERAADHAVDIAEQAWFLMTGELTRLD